jgi:hypothetical protein
MKFQHLLNLSPNTGNYNTLKKQMLTRFNLIAENTCQVIYIFPFAQIISSEEFVMSQKPQEEMNLRRDFQLPNTMDINGF